MLTRSLVLLLALSAGRWPAAWGQHEVPFSQLKKVSGEWEADAKATFRGKKRLPTYRLTTEQTRGGGFGGGGARAPGMGMPGMGGGTGPQWNGDSGTWSRGVEYLLSEAYDWVLFEAGMADSVPTGARVGIRVVVDGERAVEEILRSPEAPKPYRLPVTGKARILLEIHELGTGGMMGGMGPGGPGGLPAEAGKNLWILNPRAAKGSVPQPATGEGQPAETGAAAPETGFTEPAPFAVDPKDLDSLAADLRKAAEDTPEAKERVAKGKIAIATFDLVGVPSYDVAKNVAEDLATAMIEQKFRLVERGQLDKVLKELKVQNSGLIDPKTAKQIGTMTGCSLILVGSISDRGQSVVVNARLMDTETGESVVARRVEMKKVTIVRARPE